MTVARNAPCPCGSKKKYKRCCGADKADGPETDQPSAEVDVPAGMPTWMLPAILMLSAVGVAVVVGTLRSSVRDGVSVGLALGMLVIGYLMARNPPTSSGRGGGANINFGMGSNRSRSNRPSNRSKRRRR